MASTKIDSTGIAAANILPDTAESNPAEKARALQSSRSWAMFIIFSSAIIWAAGIPFGFQTALGAHLVFGFVLAILGLAFPSVGLFGIAMLSALDAIAADLLYTGGFLRFNTLNYWLLIVMVIFLPFLLKLKDLSTRALQIFIALLAVELAFSTGFDSGIQDILTLLATFGIVIYFARALKDEQAIYWMGVVNGIVAGIGTLVFITQMNALPYSNPNNWSFFPLTALFSICISFPYARKLNNGRLILIFLALVNTAWIFLSGSRGGLMIAILCLLYLFLSTRSVGLSATMVVIALVVGIFISTQFVQQEAYTISRIQLLLDPTQNESKRTSQRSSLAEAGIRIFLKNPMGIGTGSFREEAAGTNLFTGNRPAHSAWIKTLAENGVLGIIFLSLFIGSYAIVGMRKPQDGRLLFGLFITIVLAAAFIAKEFRGKTLFFLAASGIVFLNPENMLFYLAQRPKEAATKLRKQLREVRFGRKR